MEKSNISDRDERMQVYEVGFHIVPIVSADALPAEVNAIRSLVESTGGAIIADGEAAMRNLAYTLSRMRGGKREKFDSAYFGWVKFETLPSKIGEIKEALDKNENVLRYLIIKTVRENTLVGNRLQEAAEAAEAAAREAAEKPAEKAAAKPSEAKTGSDDMDKTIDELVS